MMDGTLFDKLEYIARVVRKSSEPFGSIQLVLSGDFFQLPPVPDQSFEYKKPSLYAFDAKTWSKCISRPIFLTKVFRQKDDGDLYLCLFPIPKNETFCPAFVGILTNMRHGTLTIEDVQQLRSLSRPLHYPDGIEPSQLFPLRRDVEGCNNDRLKELTGVQHIYQAMDSAGYDVYGMPISRENAQSLLDRMIAAPIIPLKVLAGVIPNNWITDVDFDR
ncbi:hypothetical protein M413DRAFT_214238 [Hebeloma cylindrosporum]|uniref:ATP-dependent DNA helicase n=1 Tax=Hebeloma cylindrosporum TaxID=76867 RepID=A0A0C3CVM9_HEBCY|nr:hypothetical protein M413DRAFT_214238 [Hebeloma cylindrosporum h7]